MIYIEVSLHFLGIWPTVCLSISTIKFTGQIYVHTRTFNHEKYSKNLMGKNIGQKKICLKVKIKTDASAAKGIASRRGAGKVRHIELNQLWMQDKVVKGEIYVGKVNGGGQPGRRTMCVTM